MAGYPWKYTYSGPPFNWLGTFSLSQWQAFKQWVGLRQGDMEKVSVFHRIRAEQLRKTAGVMERYYSSVYPQEPAPYSQKLAPTFQKTIWKPGVHGHFNYAPSDDHLPMVMVGRIKGQMQDMFQRDDEAVYYMNQVRCLIEKHEDLAQYAHDFTQGGKGAAVMTLSDLLAKIDGYFAKPEYKTVLVDDVNQGNMYKGEPYARVNQAEDMTQWELEQANHSSPDTPIWLVDRETIEPTTATTA